MKISRRSLFYGAASLAHVLFALTFPFYSGDLARWLYARDLMDEFIVAFSVPFFIGLAYYSFRRWRMFKKERRVILVFAIAAYLVVYFSLADHKERLHIVSFSVMAMLFYKTLSPMTRLRWAGLSAFLLASGTGIVDEIIQRWIPDRTSNLHDMMLAVKGAALGVLIGWLFDAYSRKGRS